MDFHLMVRTYNTYGGHSTFSMIPDFLLDGAPLLGSAISELTITLHFKTSGPARKTLENLYTTFHANRLNLPKVVFRRNRGQATIDVASDLINGSDWKTHRGLSLPLFKSGCEETLNALQLLRSKITTKDDFKLDAFLEHCQERTSKQPNTDEELAALKKLTDDRRTASRAAMSPWERLGIDWRDFHPDARRVLDDPFYWEQANDFSPHGNDTGADLLSDYRRWLKQHPSDDPLEFYQQLMVRWGFSDGLTNPESRSVLDEAAVALAFAELKLRADCRPSVATLAREAIERQRQAALLAADWPHRGNRMKSLDLIEAKLHGTR